MADVQNVPARLSVPIKRTTASSSRCILGCNPSQVYRVPPAVRSQIMARIGLFVPVGAKICRDYHQDENERLTEEALQELEQDSELIASESSMMSGKEVAQLISGLRKEYLDLQKASVISQLDESSLKHLTGKTKSQLEEVKEKAAEAGLRLTTDSVITYQTYLWTGMSQTLLGAIFGFSQQYACKLISGARDAMLESFAPWFLGNNRASGSRDVILRNTTRFARTLYEVDEDVAITILDGTYLWCQQSGYFPQQMATWCVQKDRNLTKPMMIVTTNGYIVDVMGLYDGKSSDADIMKLIMNDPATKPWFDATFKPGDIFVLDRGFRNVVTTLTERGFVVKILVSSKASSSLTKKQMNRGCVR